MQILKKTDLAAIGFFVLLAAALIVAFFVAGTRAGAVAAVFVEGTEVLVIDIGLNDGQRFEILSPNGMNEILVDGGAVRMIFANCPDQYCMHMGAISGVFQTITCLPNRVIVEIRGIGADDEVDVVAH